MRRRTPGRQRSLLPGPRTGRQILGAGIDGPSQSQPRAFGASLLTSGGIRRASDVAAGRPAEELPPILRPRPVESAGAAWPADRVARGVGSCRSRPRRRIRGRTGASPPASCRAGPRQARAGSPEGRPASRMTNRRGPREAVVARRDRPRRPSPTPPTSEGEPVASRGTGTPATAAAEAEPVTVDPAPRPRSRARKAAGAASVAATAAETAQVDSVALDVEAAQLDASSIGAPEIVAASPATVGAPAASTSSTCEHCGTTVPASRRFCPTCGRRVNAWRALPDLGPDAGVSLVPAAAAILPGIEPPPRVPVRVIALAVGSVDRDRPRGDRRRPDVRPSAPGPRRPPPDRPRSVSSSPAMHELAVEVQVDQTLGAGEDPWSDVEVGGPCEPVREAFPDIRSGTPVARRRPVGRRRRPVHAAGGPEVRPRLVQLRDEGAERPMLAATGSGSRIARRSCSRSTSCLRLGGRH